MRTPLPCSLRSGNFVFSTMDPNNPQYWAERWELFKHTYVVAGWGWKRCVPRRIRLRAQGLLHSLHCLRALRPMRCFLSWRCSGGAPRAVTAAAVLCTD
jgi:hypothetical protein